MSSSPSAEPETAAALAPLPPEPPNWFQHASTFHNWFKPYGEGLIFYVKVLSAAGVVLGIVSTVAYYFGSVVTNSWQQWLPPLLVWLPTYGSFGFLRYIVDPKENEKASVSRTVFLILMVLLIAPTMIVWAIVALAICGSLGVTYGTFGPWAGFASAIISLLMALFTLSCSILGLSMVLHDKLFSTFTELNEAQLRYNQTVLGAMESTRDLNRIFTMRLTGITGEQLDAIAAGEMAIKVVEAPRLDELK